MILALGYPFASWQDVINQKDERFRRRVTTPSSFLLDQVLLRLSEECDELRPIEVACAPDHEDGAVGERPFELLHLSLIEIATILVRRHRLFGLLQSCRARFEKINLLVVLQQEVDRQSARAAANIECSEALVVLD